MKWAFWRREARGAAARASRSGAVDDGPRVDPAAQLRVRARRRLIGAAALLLATVIIVPMVLDPAPRPVPDAVPIDIPSEKTPFTPRLALPPVPDAASAPMAPPDVAPAPEAPKADAPSSPIEKKQEKKAEPAKAEARPGEAQRARDLLEGKTTTAAAAVEKKGRYLLQAAAFGSEAAARDLSERLKKAGFAPFTELVQTADGPRWRVRVGPYATREEAERARTRLRGLDVNATLVLA